MEKIKGFTWGWSYNQGDWNREEAFFSIDELLERTGTTTVVLPITAVQESAQSTHVIYESEHTPTKEEIEKVIEYIQGKGCKIILKSVVNCLDDTWRAYINFISPDVVCEPKWSEWFESYTTYVLYVSSFAEKYNIDMVMIGCEMVCADAQEQEWRKLITKVRENYQGLLTYNADKYQEDRITWWDDLDVISSSGYYPVGTWKQELERIEKVVKEFKKPFFFAEAGCPARIGNESLPNDYAWVGERSEEAQLSYYEEMFTESSKVDFVDGFGLWDWKTILYPLEAAHVDDDYCVYGKKAEVRIKEEYTN